MGDAQELIVQSLPLVDPAFAVRAGLGLALWTAQMGVVAALLTSFCVEPAEQRHEDDEEEALAPSVPLPVVIQVIVGVLHSSVMGSASVQSREVDVALEGLALVGLLLQHPVAAKQLPTEAKHLVALMERRGVPPDLVQSWVSEMQFITTLQAFRLLGVDVSPMSVQRSSDGFSVLLNVMKENPELVVDWVKPTVFLPHKEVEVIQQAGDAWRQQQLASEEYLCVMGMLPPPDSTSTDLLLRRLSAMQETEAPPALTVPTFQRGISALHTPKTQQQATTAGVRQTGSEHKRNWR